MTSLDDPSGLSAAEAAYDAGVVEPSEELPNYDVQVTFVVRGTGEHAEAVAFTLASELAARSDVNPNITVSVRERL